PAKTARLAAGSGQLEELRFEMFTPAVKLDASAFILPSALSAAQRSDSSYNHGYDNNSRNRDPNPCIHASNLVQSEERRDCEGPNRSYSDCRRSLRASASK